MKGVATCVLDLQDSKITDKKYIGIEFNSIIVMEASKSNWAKLATVYNLQIIMKNPALDNRNHLTHLFHEPLSCLSPVKKMSFS